MNAAALQTTRQLDALSRRLDKLVRKLEAPTYRVAVRGKDGRILYAVEQSHPPRRERTTMTDTNGTTNGKDDTLDRMIAAAMQRGDGEPGDELSQLVLAIWQRVQGVEADIDAMDGRLRWLEARVR